MQCAMKRVKRIVKWVFFSANAGKGIELFEGRNYKVKTPTGSVWGRLVAKVSKTTVLLRDRDGVERPAEIGRDARVFKIKGKEEK